MDETRKAQAQAWLRDVAVSLYAEEMRAAHAALQLVRARVLTGDEAAAALGVSRATLYRHADAYLALVDQSTGTAAQAATPASMPMEATQ